MSNRYTRVLADLETPEARQRADHLNAYKQEIIEQRWLSTLILSVHLELEACLEVLLTSAQSATGSPTSRIRNATFSAKLARCADAALLEPKVIGAVAAVNKLRNELAHRLDNKPTEDSIFRFIESMSAMHPISVTDQSGDSEEKLTTFSEISAHFSGAQAEILEDFVFVSMMLLRATLVVQVKKAL